MTTLTDRPATALLVIDVQRDVVVESHDRDAVVSRIVTLVDRARHEEVPVVWVQHSDEELARGSEGWAFVPELVVQPGESVVSKAFGDAFEDTDLEQVLLKLGAGQLIVAGAQTDACIRSTIHGAFTRGYDVVLVGDAHTVDDHRQWGAPAPEQVIAHTNLYWQFQSAPGRSAGVAAAADVALSA